MESMSEETKNLVAEAGKVYTEHFPLTTCFERAIFFSWSCAIKDCTFCYMSTQEKRNKNDADKSLRSEASMYAEALLCKVFGWDIGFYTGGIGARPFPKHAEIVKNIRGIVGKKVWISLGALPRNVLELFKDDAAGVVGSIETINWVLQKKVCPSKPYQPYLKMFEYAQDLGLPTAITFIVGLGETHADLANLKKVIQDYGVEKIHMYGLIPHPGTEFAGAAAPSAEEQAWWIAQTRIAFPQIDIQCGIWTDRMERISLLLQAGANSISKFPIVRKFGGPEAKAIEAEAAKAGREFTGTLTKMRDVDWGAEVSGLTFLDDEMRVSVKLKLDIYLKQMNKSINRIAIVKG
jgi:biotin synthase-like enzyme